MSYVGRGPATSRSPVQGVLPLCQRIHSFRTKTGTGHRA